MRKEETTWPECKILQVHPPVLLILLLVPFSTGAHFCAVNPVLIYLSVVLL